LEIQLFILQQKFSEKQCLNSHQGVLSLHAMAYNEVSLRKAQLYFMLLSKRTTR